MSDLRVYGFSIQVENEGAKTKIVQVRKAVSDLEDTVQELNKSTGDNVTVTAEMVQTEKEAAAQTRMIINQREKSIRQTKSVIEQYTRLNQTIREYGTNSEVVNAITRLGSNATDDQKRQVSELVTEYQRLRTAGDGTKTSMKNLRGVAQNFGWQLQDVVVQAQMGTNAFTILSQQGSQMAASFGAYGALIGAGIAIAGAAIPALISAFGDATKETQSLEKAQESLNSVLDSSSVSVNGVTQQLMDLYKVDASLARLRLIGAMQSAQTEMDQFNKEIKESIGGTLLSISSLENAISNTDILQNLRPSDRQYMIQTLSNYGDKLDETAKKLGVNREQLSQLGAAYTKFRSSGDTDELTSTFDSLSKESEKLTPQFRNLVLQYSELAAKGKLASAQMDELKKMLSGESEITTKNARDTESLIDKYDRLTRQLRMSERQRRIDTFLRTETNELTKEEIESTVSSMNAYYDQAEAIKAAEEARKEEVKRIKERNELLKPIEQRIQTSISADDSQKAALEEKQYKETIDILKAQLEATKQWEYSERSKLNTLIEQEETRHNNALQNIANETLQGQLQNMGLFLGNVSGVLSQLEQAADEGSAKAKALFYLNRSIQFAQTVVNTESAAIKAMGQLGAFGIPVSTMIRATGYASAGVIAGTTFAGAYDNGGYIPSGMTGIVAEYGDELVNGQLISGPANVTSREDTAKMLNSGVNVNIINNASGVEHTVNQIDENTVEIIATKVFNKNIDQGVSSVLGQANSRTNKAMKNAYKVSRRV